MALPKVICWAIIFILHVNKCKTYYMLTSVKKMEGRSLARDILEDKDNRLKL